MTRPSARRTGADLPSTVACQPRSQSSETTRNASRWAFTTMRPESSRSADSTVPARPGFARERAVRDVRRSTYADARRFAYGSASCDRICAGSRHRPRPTRYASGQARRSHPTREGHPGHRAVGVPRGRSVGTMALVNTKRAHSQHVGRPTRLPQVGARRIAVVAPRSGGLRPVLLQQRVVAVDAEQILGERERPEGVRVRNPPVDPARGVVQPAERRRRRVVERVELARPVARRRRTRARTLANETMSSAHTKRIATMPARRCTAASATAPARPRAATRPATSARSCPPIPSSSMPCSAPMCGSDGHEDRESDAADRDPRTPMRCGARSNSRTPRPASIDTARLASHNVRPQERNSLAPGTTA